MNRQLLDKAFEKAVWQITKYASEKDFKEGNPYEKVEFYRNCLVNEGINHILTILATDAKTGTPFGNATALLVVGTGTPAGTATPVAAATDTLATFTAPVTATMETSFPTYGTSQKVTWKSSYGTPTANQDWCEFGVLSSTPSGKLLNRMVSDQGIKISGQVWELSLEITLS